METRHAEIERNTSETRIHIKINIDGSGIHKISTGIPFFDHMLTLFTVHGFMDLSVKAHGDIDVDFHHTVEDVGLVLGECVDKALGNRKGIKRYGYAVTPMDEALAEIAIDLSKRPFLVYNVPHTGFGGGSFDVYLAKEFFRSFSNKAGMNLHINVDYGENEHHIIESIFKSTGRALDQAVTLDPRIIGVCSTKGIL
ncbi:Imidazoleglycerol-phosphate dehydratase [Desulfonema limicola]|uniref:Imidazoleglycerol-phosphate dehydratase n=1 Tax=Desulfonema limicola TaxID=45656 RepID=A0A975BAR8_9BACT|nr:imidazoleglycerol-phosphate dehydratase HisB [Desulfonema limicola]QTA81983.1 Imidazoleglycerol-phosphate dehydratase [Desulfonema limicola]